MDVDSPLPTLPRLHAPDPGLTTSHSHCGREGGCGDVDSPLPILPRVHTLGGSLPTSPQPGGDGFCEFLFLFFFVAVEAVGNVGRPAAGTSDQHQGENRPGCPSGVVRPAATNLGARHEPKAAGLSTPRHCPAAARRRGCGQCGQAGRRDASDEHQGDNRPGCPSGVVRPAATQLRTRHQGPRAAGLSTPRHCPSVACVGDTAANETSEPGSKASGHAAGRRLGGLGMLDAQQGWRNLRRTSRRMRRSSGPLRSTLPAHGWPDTSGPAAMEVRQ